MPFLTEDEPPRHQAIEALPGIAASSPPIPA